MTKQVTEEMVNKALASLDAQLAEDVSKASESSLDQPEGADLGNPAKEKMSDAAKGKKAEKSVKKEEKEDESDTEQEGEDAGEGEGMELSMKKKDVKKSFTELPTEVQEQIDVSDFLKSLVKHTGETIDALGEAIMKSDAQAEARFSGLSEQVAEIQKSQAKIGVVLKALCEKAGIISSAPARVAKSEMVAKSQGVVERSFAQAEDSSQEEKMFKSLSNNPIEAKGQITNALVDLVKSGACSDMDLINFESTHYLRPEIVEQLKTKLN